MNSIQMVSIENIKIVLINIESNSERVKRQFSPPFGIPVAASVLRKQNINVVIKHIIENEETESTLLSICQGAFAVGFSTMTSSNLVPTIRATRYVKSLGLYTFWGGIHATLLPELSLNEPSLDAVLRGEAESNLYQFVLWRMGQLSSNSVKGLCFKNNVGDIIISEIPLPIAEYEMSYHSFDLLDLSVYYEKENINSTKKNYIKKKMLPYMTSKGCNKKCTFCYNSVVNKCIWRGYQLDNVFSEMDWLIDIHGIEGWLFYDDNFFVNPNRAWQIIERYKMPSFVEIDLMKINNEFIERAKKSNIEKLFIGIESGSDQVLKHIKKGITSKLIREKVEMCSNYNLNIELSFMMLFPKESVDDLRKTFDLVDELSLYSNVSIAGPKIYNPYPGTSMYNDLLISGWSVPVTNEEWSKFERNISPTETGFSLTEGHLELLKSRGVI
jgi:radical SAM superfamily enzyme YgiQ (UPF0313 family)